MIKQILPIVVAACFAPAFAGEGWLTDMDAAKKQAAEQKKDLFIEFTGSDWCPPCMKLKADVFSKEEFLKAAQKDFVLVELDYPRGKEQPAELKAANEKLAGQYQIEAFPTIVFAFPDGKPFATFRGGMPMEGVMKEMQDAVKNKTALQNALDKVAKATTDDAKLAALIDAWKLVPKTFADSFYGDIKAEILKLDKDDKSGLKAADANAARLDKERAGVKEYFTKAFQGQPTPAEALKAVRAYPDRDKLLPETQQDLLMIEFNSFLGDTGDVDGAVLILDKVAELAPGSEAGQAAPRMKEAVLTNKDKIKEQVEAAKKTMKEREEAAKKS